MSLRTNSLWTTSVVTILVIVIIAGFLAVFEKMGAMENSLRVGFTPAETHVIPNVVPRYEIPLGERHIQPNLSLPSIDQKGFVEARPFLPRFGETIPDLDDLRIPVADHPVPQRVQAQSPQRTVPDSDPTVASTLQKKDEKQSSITPFDERDAEFDRNSEFFAESSHKADRTERLVLRQALEKLIEQHFEYRQQLRKVEIDQLKRRIEALEQTQLRRHQNKADLLKRRLEELLAPAGELEWDDPQRAANLTPDQNQDERPEADPLSGSDTKVPTTSDSPEQTFDGVPYSRWLHLLETERKPEKLAAAIEACSKLAKPEDHHRIARGIFRAADPEVDQNVSNESMSALTRLKVKVVFDELMAALKDEQRFATGRVFQGRLLTQQVYDPFNRLLKSHADEVVNALIRLVTPLQTDADYMLFAASHIWALTVRPLDDFPQLKPLILRMLEEQNQISPLSSKRAIQGERYLRQWISVAQNIVDREPDTPNLALMLVRHQSESPEVISLIGSLGPRARPVESMLVDRFLRDWKNYDQRTRQEIYKTFRGTGRSTATIQSLEKIGFGEREYGLLRQLKLIERPHPRSGTATPSVSPPSPGEVPEMQFFSMVDEMLRRIEPIKPADPSILLLDDRSLMNGLWNVELVTKHWKVKGDQDEVGAKVQREEFSGHLVFLNYGIEYSQEFRQARAAELFVVEKEAPIFAFRRFQIDDSTSPKQITLISVDDPSRKIKGIYDLTETTLRLQLAEYGKPRPTDFVKDVNELPEGQFVLELVRSFDPEYQKPE